MKRCIFKLRNALLKNKSAIACLEQVDKMLQIIDEKKQITLCHYPIAEWNDYFREAWHIYGHIHNKREETFEIMGKKDRALNAGCMINNYVPVTTWIVAAYEEMDNVEAIEDPWKNIISKGKFYHEVRVRGDKKNTVTYSKFLDTLAANWNKVAEKCYSAKYLRMKLGCI